MIFPSDHSGEPLLKTKLSAPKLRLSRVARPRLLSRLGEGLWRPLTLICAPAGYGKTTLLVEWLSSLKRGEDSASPVVGWLSLDEGDNAPARFQRYLATAFERAGAKVGEETRAALESFPPSPLQISLTLLINDLVDYPVPFILVLDDYQIITNPDIHAGIAYMLDHAPVNLHLVIATRFDPPLPVGRLRAGDRLVEVRAEQLRFTYDEATAFLNQVMNLALSPANVEVLENRTEGWIAGLQMAAIAMQSHLARGGESDIAQFIQTFSGSHRYILDYLAGEALNRLSAETGQFIKLTAVLDRFCVSLCSAVVGESEQFSRETISYLDEANLFLIALDDEKRWYRFHQLFADLLKARLLQDQPEMVPELERRASRWFEQHGLITEAIQYALSAHDFEQAASWIEQYGPARWSQSDTAIMLMAELLPLEMLIAKPRLGIYQAWIKTSQGQPEEAIRLLNDLQQETESEEVNPEFRWIQGFTRLLLAYITNQSGDQALSGLPDYQDFELMPEQDLGLRNTADILYAMLLSRRGELEAAADILVNCVQRDVTGRGTTAISMAIPFLARIRLMQGRLHEAAALCSAYLEPVTEKGKRFFYTAGSLNIHLGEVLREWNELGAAEEQIQEGIQANQPWKNILTDALGYAALARVQEAKGDLPAAIETLQRLEAMFTERAKPPDWETELRSLRVRLWLAIGDVARASQWADGFTLSEPIDIRQELDYLTLGRVRFAEGRYLEAQKLMEIVNRAPGLEKRINRKIKFNILLANALFRQNKLPQAFNALKTCLDLGEPDDHIRLFLDGGEATRELLSVYLQSPTATNKIYAQKLLADFSGPSAGISLRKSRGAGLDVLTPREREVLQWMTEGYSNQQIADKLVLSEGTVKFYVHNVLDKLQVHSRTQAIARGRELGLVNR